MKPTVKVEPNAIDCIHQGALAFGNTCFAKRADLAHVECVEANREYARSKRCN